MNLSRCSICSVEIGSKIFAILNLILTVSSTIWTSIICADAYTRSAVHSSHSTTASIFVDYLIVPAFDFFLTIAATVALIFSIVAFIFAVVLVNGIYKKKSTQVYAYYVYGIIVEILSALAIGYSFVEGVDNIIIPIAMLAVCICYGLILYMIKKTYVKFQTLNEQYNHQPLTEKC